MKKHETALTVIAALLVMSFFFYTDLRAQSDQNAPDAKVVILSPVNLAKKAQYVNSDVIGRVLYNSINTFIGVVPGVLATNAPTGAEHETNLNGDLFKQWNADYVLYGSYTLQGPKMNPTALIEWKVWSRSGNNDILAKNYRSLTDIEIFDVVDDIITNTAQSILKRKIGISVLAFNNFRVGGVPHIVLLNGKTVAVASNDNFSLSLKVPSEAPFRYQIKRMSDNKTVSAGTVNIASGDSTNISYSAPSGLQLVYERQSLHLQTEGYYSGTNLFRLGIFGAPRELLQTLRSDPLNSGNLARHSVNRILGWSFLGLGFTGTVFVLTLGNTNTLTNIAPSQRGLVALGTLLGALTSFVLSDMFFTFSDNDLEKAVWNYNRYILLNGNPSTRRDELTIELFSFAKEF